MKQELKIEIDRAFRGKGLKISLGIGMFISMAHIVQWIIPHAKGWNEMVQYFKSDMQYPISLYYEWMCGNTYNPEGFLYFLILPLLAVLPYSISFYQDREKGFVHQICVRTERINYFIAKTVAAFLAGGIAVTVPLVVNFLICAMFLPALPIQGLAGTFINTSVLWYRIFAVCPIVYVLIFLILDFIFAGLTACLPLFFSFFSEKKYVILMMPFVIQVFVYALCMMSGKADMVKFSAVYLFFAGIGCPSALILTGYIIVYSLVGGVLFWKIGCAEDIY